MREEMERKNILNGERGGRKGRKKMIKMWKNRSGKAHQHRLCFPEKKKKTKLVFSLILKIFKFR